MTIKLDLEKNVVQLCEDIVNIESVSGNEQKLADLIFSALKKYEHLNVSRVQNNIIANTNFNKKKRVIIAGHIDTVPLANNLPAKYIQINNKEALWGRGSVDMKAGVAMQLHLAAKITNSKYDITWLWYENEEVAAEKNGLNILSQKMPEIFQADFGILGEPSNAEVEAGCNGTLRFIISTKGKAAHSARSWMGHNAIHDLAEPLKIAANFNAKIFTIDSLEYREGLNAVFISGGIAGNVVPDKAQIEFNYRFAPNKTAEQAYALMQDLFKGYSISLSDSAPGALPNLQNTEINNFVLQTASKIYAKQGWTDVARLAALGVPAVNFGPGDPLKAHADDEHVFTADIVSCTNSLYGFLKV